MALDPRIILAGQVPDTVNTLARSTQAASLANANQRQNALAQTYKQYGPGILAGDQNALNVLAQQDPTLALGVQNTLQDNRMAESGLAMREQEFGMRVREYKSQISREQAAAEAAEIKKGVFMGSKAQTPQQWDQLMQGLGQTDLVGQFENRDMLMRQYMTAAEILDADEGPEEPTAVRSLRIRAQEAGLQPGTPEFQEFMRTGGKTEASRVIMGPDNKPIFAEGDAAKNIKFTEGQSKDNVFVTRAKGALEVLEPVAGALVSRGNRIAEVVPGGIGREFQDADFQVAKQAGDEFLQAILRKDTGAAITPAEQELYGITYLPQPGDQDEVLEAKRNARARAVDAIEAGMSPLQQLVVDQALVKGAQRQGTQGAGTTPAPSNPRGVGGGQQSQSGQDFTNMGIADLAKVDVTTLDEAGLDAFLEAMQAARGQ
ncbi:MAG: hypothetical protein Tp118SUR00d2C21406231_14 [Prokaryotic dsDNA virus sp.]|nr:MAG: hypothetical protein Tp125DCM00d2C40298531_33 [Prokaryotic dsDNA virus sp.]QDP53134.1 MAG: hypothetical protein Tp118SUR00d2C21406231_14 [Prokaryotic dsDNA virus sp.]|tara:strand:+ start:9029 stop:10321 length:1293 start_codon:yes stop_codon:yes gene_type:complete